MSRRAYLDWLRGVAVLIMVEAHTLDAWTRSDDRSRDDFQWALVVGGFGAPTFLFLAGVALALAGGARLDRGMSPAEAAARARRRGWQIFGFAFLFRLQSAVLGAGGVHSFLKVDILNVMGLSMLAAAVLWGLAQGTAFRIALMAGAAAATAMLTPIVRATTAFDWLPDPIEAYINPVAAYSGFTLLPWGGFLLAGAAVGVWLEKTRTPSDERRMIVWLALLGPALAAGGYALSLLPPIYRETSFWTSSPTFFMLRLGMLVAAIPVAYAWMHAFRGRSRIQELGIASLFVYWVHVEMVYGFLTWPIHRRLSFEQSLAAFVLFTMFLYWLVRMKDRLRGMRHKTTHG